MPTALLPLKAGGSVSFTPTEFLQKAQPLPAAIYFPWSTTALFSSMLLSQEEPYTCDIITRKRERGGKAKFSLEKHALNFPNARLLFRQIGTYHVLLVRSIFSLKLFPRLPCRGMGKAKKQKIEHSHWPKNGSPLPQKDIGPLTVPQNQRQLFPIFVIKSTGDRG